MFLAYSINAEAGSLVTGADSYWTTVQTVHSRQDSQLADSRQWKGFQPRPWYA
jgi:hypothetical protein